MTTLNIRSLQVLATKINQRLNEIKDIAMNAQEFNQFKRYVGYRDALNEVLQMCEDVEKEMNS